LKKGGDSTGLVKILAQYTLLCLYHATFGLYVRLRYRLKCVNHSPISRKGSFFLLGNHTNNFDGLFIQCLFFRPIRFVVTDDVFKNKALSRLLYLVDFIPKRKSVSDVAAIRSIINVTRRGGIVGIFPEGGRNWDGVTGPITPATFRLIEMLKLPVVTATIRGGYLSQPRWADRKRHGRVEVHLDTVIEAGSSLSRAEIAQRITAALAHNEYDWQRSARIPYHGRALCRGLERLMFICPICGAVGTVVSSNNDARCASCKSRFSLDVWGFLHSDGGTLPADSLDRINEWQQQRLASLFSGHPLANRLISDEGGILLCAPTRNDPFKVIGSGTAVLNHSQFIIDRYTFELSGITGIHVYFKSHMEFKYQSADYRLGFNNPYVSAFKWQCAVELAKKRISAEA